MGEAELVSLYVHYTYTLKQLTLAKLQGIFGGVPIGFLGALCHHSGPPAWQGTISDRRVGYGEVIQHGAVRCKLRALHFENTHDNLSHHFFPRKVQTS